MAEIDGLLKLMTERGSSDLHVKAGSPPVIRLNGRLVLIDEIGPCTPDQARALALGMMNARQRQEFEERCEIDFAYSLSGVGRFRVNTFRQRGSVGMTLRRVTTVRSTFEELGLPSIIGTLADEPRGLVLVTGTAGSGKTTTLAAMINHINSTRESHIITIEDPIEVLHQDKRSIISQREIGVDTESYADALRHVVRQDPDVILIGEMRDYETVSAAISAAEIGNLVLSTLHTVDATETVSRIIDFFPPFQQRQIRLMLAATLKGIISLRLIPSIQGGLVPAVEVMVMTGTIREYINDAEKTHMLRDAMEEGEYYGMVTFDKSLLGLYQDNLITLDDAIAMSHNAHDFRLKVKQLGIDPLQAVQSGVY
ncbi:MAG: PilT/PilU family type 4a pilus ATPase [Coriobacteriia bacterium]|nr:PilT/PilU family type 4a pilus ATPase [Coriobacteriia bacterium]